MLWCTTNALLNCSRQSGKSTTAAHKAVHTALFHEKALVLVISPSLRQSAELFRKVIDVVEALPVPPKLTEDNKLSLQFQENRSRIVSLPSTEATIRGFSAVNLVIIDEASRVSDALYGTLRPMLAISKGQLVAMSTPFGQRGFFYDEWQRRAKWTAIRITAEMCPRITAEFLAEERDALGDSWFRQEYGGEFIEAVGQLFSEASIQAALSNEVDPLFPVDPLEQLWDSANTRVRNKSRIGDELADLFQRTAANGAVV